MISVRLYKTNTGATYGFEIKNHGKSVVCAAVSALAQNAVNSIEEFTGDKVVCDYDNSGGYLKFEHPALKAGDEARDASLLINSMVFGLSGIRDKYPGQIEIASAN